MAEAELSIDGNRVEYLRENLTEWYVNDERGLEQGFTIPSPPLPLSSVPLLLELTLTGDLTPNLTEDGSGIELTTRGGVRVLHYGELYATDAAGRELAAWFEVRGAHISILVDDTDATYPITIDPLATTPSWTAESDQADANFGISVGTAGDVNGDGYADVIIGARHYDNGQMDEGRAFVYYGSASGLSTSADWAAESDQASARFGYSVGTAGDVNGDGYADVIVGAHYYDNGQTDEGRVYVYHGSASGLSATVAWTAEGNQASATLGYSVGTAGDVNGDGYADVIVGASNYSNGQFQEGRAFVYHGSASGLNATAAWMVEGNQGVAHLGVAVGTAGDVNGDGYADVIVGASYYSNGQTYEGQAYVYYGSVSGLSVTAAWTVEGNQAGANFGHSVGTAGDVNGDGYADIIVGADQYDNGQVDEGRAFVYYGSASGLSTSADWTAESDQALAHFGYSADTAGDVNGDGYADVIVGAPYYDNDQTNEGRVYVYHGSASGLSVTAVWTAESDQADALFGRWTSTAGDVNDDGYADVVVGAYLYDNGQADEGRAFVYYGGPDDMSTTAAWTAEGGQDGAHFGRRVSTAGDVNGDGYSDVIIGAPQYDNGHTDEGKVYAYHGSASGLSPLPDWTAEGNQASAGFGNSASTAGDVNGDGYADVIVGAPKYNGGQTEEGRVYVYHGSASGLSTSVAWSFESNQAGARLGSASSVGDVNGDGYGDVIVGASAYSNEQSDEGRAYVFHGSVSGLEASPGWIVESNQASANFGTRVGTAGDVNRDGYTDAIVGALHYDNGEMDEGRVYVYHGSASGLSAAADWTAESNQAGAEFGHGANTAGDVNGDGYADIVIGAPYGDYGEIDEGRVFVYYGSASGLNATPAWTAESDQANAKFGNWVSSAGDVNGDGYADVIIGALRYDNGEAIEGRAYIYYGSDSGLSIAADWTAGSNQDEARFGNSVGAAGDVNGDGYADIIVGAPYYDNDQADEGHAFLYYGNGCDGLHLLPRQMRSDGVTPIALGGMSDSATSVKLSLIGRSPAGRERVKIEYQVAPLGTSFDAATGVISSTSAAWTDVLTTGVAITETVTGLTPGTPYHWRARLLYPPGNRLGQPASRWVHSPENGWHETDFRTADEPPAYGIADLLLEDLGGGTTVELTPAHEGFGHFDILRDGDTNYLWVNSDIYPSYGAEQRLESTDGLVWHNRTDTNLTGPSGTYKRLEGLRTVIKENGIYEGWEQYYYEWSVGWGHAHRYVTSTNGITWTVVNHPALIGSIWADVIKDGNTYHMWATVDFDPGMSSEPQILRHRTSTDGGTGWGDWRTGGEAVTVDGEELELSLVRVRQLPDDTYQLFYHAYKDSQINLATSNDGIHFTTTVTNLLNLEDVLPPGVTFLHSKDFLVIDVNGEDWIYFTFRDQDNNDHIAVSRPYIASDAAFSGSPLAGAVPLTVTFTDQSTGDVTAWLWDFGDGVTSTLQHPTHTYTITGTYTISLTVSGPAGGDTEIKTAYVTAGYPTPDAAFSAAPLTGEAPLTVQFTDLSTGAIVQWDWTFGDGGVSGGRHPEYEYSAPGTYTVSLTVSGPGGSDTETKAAYITVTPPVYLPPVASIDFIAPDPAVQGQDTVYFSGSGQDEDEGGEYIAAYEWTSDVDGPLSTQPDFTVQASALSTGTHTISFRVQDDEGEWSPEVTRTLTVEPPPAIVRTLILVNRQKLETLYGASEADQVMGKLTDLALHDSVEGLVIQVESSPTVAATYTLWDADPTSTSRANDVAEAIKALVDARWADHPNLEYLVIVGDDRVIPFYRVPDGTRYPESHYGPVSPATTVGAALQDDMTLTDDYYGDEMPVVLNAHGWHSHEFYVPDLGVGRLIETPAEIVAQIDAFLANDEVSADDAIVTGYQFVADVAQEVCSELNADGLTTDCTLIGNSWTAGQFESAVLDTRHDLVSFNGHANHYLIGAPSGYVSSSDVVSATADHTQALFYTPGCHSGLNVPPTNPYQPLDTAQAMIQNEAVYVANTGYGWGYIFSIGLSEQLMLDFTERLVYGQSATVGQALTAAKREYYLSDRYFDAYDEKIMLESTLYGLPMLRYATSATPDAPPDAVENVSVDGEMRVLDEGLTVNSLSYQFPALLAETTGEGQYYTLGDRVHASDERPIQPKYVADLSFPGTNVHGIVFAGGTYTDVLSFNPIVDRAITETTVLEPAFTAPGWYPALPHHLTRLEEDGRLVTVLGQFSAQGQTERLYEQQSFDVYYHVSSNDWTPPTILDMSSVLAGENVFISVKAEDDAGNIHTVVIAYTNGDGVWSSTSLVRNGGGWSGSFPANAETTFFVQVVDEAGNVAFDDNNGLYFEPGDGSLDVYLPLVLKMP